MAKKARKGAAGKVLLKARKNEDGSQAGGCSIGGTEYTNDKEGIIEVPAEFVDVLKFHGYDPVPVDADDEPEAPTE